MGMSVKGSEEMVVGLDIGCVKREA